MLILGFAGSPRRKGNSELLLDEALAGAHSAGAAVEKIVLSELDFTPCISCGACEKSGDCIFDDGMQALYDKIGAADALIFASPIYFYSVSAWAKGAIDRGQALWARKYVLKDKRYTAQKKGYFIGVGATKGERLFTGAELTVKYYYDAAGFEYTGSLLVRGMEGKGDVKKSPEHLLAARDLGSEAVR